MFKDYVNEVWEICWEMLLFVIFGKVGEDNIKNNEKNNIKE